MRMLHATIRGCSSAPWISRRRVDRPATRTHPLHHASGHAAGAGELPLRYLIRQHVDDECWTGMGCAGASRRMSQGRLAAQRWRANGGKRRDLRW